MPLIIDGNNVLLCDKPDMFSSLDELGLCKALMKSKWIKQKITIYFDGHRTPLTETFSPSDQIDIVYSQSKDADSFLLKRIEDSTAPGNLTVVSSDNHIYKPAKRKHCKCVKSDEFLKQLAKELSLNKTKQKPKEKPAIGKLSEKQTAEWLKEFGIDK